ncbi:hypothetical protein SAMN05421781_0388 [Marinococcus luteus]|uniref:Uncharacterized protein n=1 Tax=Marinococcus luteus TaxID=1122204 RepID=A0A1H2QMR7_9BACI|nr:hypothetical protein SAMN05421781_0388 [Marinococcus luteus]
MAGNLFQIDDKQKGNHQEGKPKGYLSMRIIRVAFGTFVTIPLHIPSSGQRDSQSDATQNQS